MIGLFLPVCQLHLHLADIAPAAILSVVALLAVERRHIAAALPVYASAAPPLEAVPVPVAMAANSYVTPEFPIVMPGLPAPLPTTSIPNQHTTFGGNSEAKPLRDWRRSSF